ncbi:MAG: ABC transporter permease [Bacteroidales bacterium]|nr:ABC transporter permease [Bacteroidales bacterium]
MNKTLLIIAREYLTRVRKKSFIILTLLGPLIMAALIIVPVYVATQSERDAKILVVDDNDYYINRFTDTEHLHFSYQSGDIEELKMKCVNSEYDAVLHILSGSQSTKLNLYYGEEPPMSLRENIESQMNKLIFDKTVKDSLHVDPKKFDEIKEYSRVSIVTLQLDENGEEKESFADMNRMIGLICGFLIYMFIFMFASQVLRGVLEEKTNRIVEVLISSVKPFQLLMGKIVGVALVGLTQFVLWVMLTFVIVGGVQLAAPDFFGSSSPSIEATAPVNASQMQEMTGVPTVAEPSLFQQLFDFYPFSFMQLIICFLFYFLFGYLMYASLFAAVGSAVDNETDSNQFTLPITIPLLLTIMLIVPIAESPNGSLSWWLSMIPLTSPVAMLIRLPSGVPLTDLLLSMALLVAFFVFSVWFAAKVYRVGILMYGKKITYRDMFKWLKY